MTPEQKNREKWLRSWANDLNFHLVKSRVQKRYRVEDKDGVSDLDENSDAFPSDLDGVEGYLTFEQGGWDANYLEDNYYGDMPPLLRREIRRRKTPFDPAAATQYFYEKVKEIKKQRQVAIKQARPNVEVISTCNAAIALLEKIHGFDTGTITYPGDAALKDIAQRAWDLTRQAMASEVTTLSDVRAQAALLLMHHRHQGNGPEHPDIELPLLNNLLRLIQTAA
jgi:hypothetical protein